MKPLTAEQQQFAAAHHELVNRYLSHHRLSEEDYYDVVIFGFLRAVQNYLEHPELKKYAFSSIACREMNAERRKYQQKQKGFSPMARVFSLESPISRRVPARESLMEGLQLQEMLETLNRAEQEILDLLLCYGETEAQRQSGLCKAEFDRHRDTLRRKILAAAA